MTAGVDLERRLADWFVEDAPVHAPDRVLLGAMERVDTVGQRRGLTRRIGRRWDGLTRRQRVALALVMTLALVGGAIAIGAFLLQRDELGGASSLVLASPGAATPDDGGITVSLRAPDGSMRVLATFTAEMLGARYADGAGVAASPDGHLAIPVSTPGGASEYRIVDLRDPSAPPRAPDAEAMFATWGPGDRLAMVVNSGDLTIYDAHTGLTSAVTPDGGSPRDILFRPAWALDGSGLQANESEGPGFGVLGLDGTFVAGATPMFETGIGARRTDATGGRLQCLIGEDYGCEDGYTLTMTDDSGSREVYVDDDPLTRIADFSVALDGGLWLLLQATGTGPREIRLQHLAVDGTVTDHGTFGGVADDPDESSFFDAATFAGFAADDAQILVRLAGENGSFGETWAVEPATGVRVQLEGTPAGWLAEDGLSAPRPSASLAEEAPPDVRGGWAAVGADGGLRRLTVRRTSGELDGAIALVLRAESADRLAIRQAEAGLGCDVTTEGVYGWSVDGDSLRLTVVDDPCADRVAALDASFERSMPVPDSGSASIPAGQTVLAAEFAVPFRLTAPPGGATGIGSHRDTDVAISSNAEGFGVSIFPVTDGVLDPCDRHGAPVTMAPGIEGVLAYLGSLVDHGITTTPTADVTIAGAAYPSVTIAVDPSCGDTAYVFERGRSAMGGASGTRVTLLEPRPGTILAILASPEAVAEKDWLESIIASIEFLD